MFDLLRSGILNLGRKKSRSFMTVTGITIGVASVVLIASIGDIGKFTISQELGNLGMGGLLVSKNSKIPGAELGEEQLSLIRQSGLVDSAAPIMLDYTKTYMRELMMDAAVWGIDYGANQVLSLTSLHGRLITKNDVFSHRKVCLVDSNVALAYYKRENVVGKKLTIQTSSGTQELEIVGVVSSGGSLMQGLIGEVIPNFVYMPYTTMQDATGKQSFDQIAVRVKDGIDVNIAETQIASSLDSFVGVKGGYKAENMFSQKEKLDGILDIITLVLSAIAGVSLIVAGLSIMTVMLVSVNERTREIGIKKSIGANRRDILKEFIAEAFIISVIGSVVGSAAGIIVIVAGCVPMGFPIRINMQIIGFCMLFSIFIGVVFGVYPASVASKLRPVDALRYE